MEYSAQELYDLLNDSDECRFIEAKTASDKSQSLLRTVSAFSNEPNAGGGYLLLGISPGQNPDINRYEVTGISNIDKAQLDLAGQCNTAFNIPIRVEIKVEKPDGKNILIVFVPELSIKQKPLYLVKDGFPKGAYRRIGSADQMCSDVDIPLFYSDERTYDQTIITGSSLDDIDDNALNLYRRLRDVGLFVAKGGGRSSYYIASQKFIRTYNVGVNRNGDGVNRNAKIKNPYGNVDLTRLSSISTKPKPQEDLLSELPKEIQVEIRNLKKRELNQEKIYSLIEKICRPKAFRAADIALLLNRKEKTTNEYIQKLINKGILNYCFPDMIRHPEQAYMAVKKSNDHEDNA